MPDPDAELVASSRCADDLAALHRVAALGTGDTEARLDQWLDAGCEVLGARQGVVLLGTADELAVRAAVGGEAGGVLVGDEIVDRRVQDALDRRATVADLGGVIDPDDADLELGVGAVVASPLWVTGRLAGSVAFVVPPGRPAFSPWALALVDVIADGVARVLEHQADTSAHLDARAEQIAFEALVASVSTHLIACTAETLDDAITDALAQIGSFFGADAGALHLLSSDGSALARTHRWRGDHGGGEPVALADDPASAALIDELRRVGHLVAGPGPDGDPSRSASALLTPGAGTDLLVRLGSGEDLAGVLVISWRDRPPAADREDLGLVRLAADAFHGAIRRRSAAQLALGQAHVFESIARNETVTSSLLGVRDLVARNLPGATALLLTVDGDELHLVTDDVQPGSWARWFADLPLDLTSPYGQAATTGEPVVVTDVDRDPRFGPLAVPDRSFRSVTVLPVKSAAHARPLALLVLLGPDRVAPTLAPAVRDSAASLIVVALERERDLQRLAYQATHDPLTGVGNRAALVDRLTLALARSRRTGRRVAVLFCDLDGFKAVNDRFGHEGGDRLLVEVADRIRQAVRPSDTVSRTGGDEFVVVCEDLEDGEQAHAIADRITDSVSGSPARLGEIRLDVALSIGVAMADSVLDHPDRLLHAADLAMYRSKEQGRNRRLLRAIAPDSARAAAASPVEREEERLLAEQVRHELSRAIGEDQLDLLEQPIVGRDGSLVGVEVLLRWDEASPGPLHPAQIVLAAEELGLTATLGRWVRRRALALRQAWPVPEGRNGRPPVHVNVSGPELVADGFVEAVIEDLADHGAHREDLVLEVREVDLHLAGARRVLDDLDRLDVPVLVDAAGEGGLPLAELTRLPIRGIKLAPTLVPMVTFDPVSLEVVRALILLAHGVGWRSLAVGVETDQQRSVLFGFGVAGVQGRAVASPMSAGAFATWSGWSADPGR